jgi:Calcineurin-like phosphoesterase
MRIQLLSDLHLEAHPHFVPEPAAGADVLVLAGDIGSYQEGSSLRADDWGLTRFSPVPALGGAGTWPTPVLFIPGNHEYDARDVDETHAAIKAVCQRLGITWLDRQTLQLGAVRFIGTTLWTDFDALIAPNEPMTSAMKKRNKAFSAANFHLKKAQMTRHGAPFLALEVRDEGLRCQAWLQAALSEPFDGKTVVITHFAPSLQSRDPHYGLQPGTAGFCNALDDLFTQADLWLHGHLHCQLDYRAGRCRVVANPLGYARKNEQLRFEPRLLLEV